jgi:hypothetical protein
MKKFSILVLLALMVINYSASACNEITITRSRQQEDRTIGSFKGIAAGGALKVKVTMGNKETIRLEGNADAIAELTTVVIDGVLTIKPKTKWSDWSRKFKRPDVTAYITAKKLTSLTMSGSGNMEVINGINSTDLVATLSGSGSIKAIANVKNFTGVLSGSGNLNLTGKASESNLTLSGSGEFNGKGFSVNDLSVQISGSANVYIAASERIDAVISGSGNVYYSGNARISKTTIGSGRVRKL